MNVIEAKEVLVTHTHLALSLEYAAGGSLTSYVADRWQHAQHAGLFLSEDEARYFFRVGPSPFLVSCVPCLAACIKTDRLLCVLQQFIGAVEYCHHHLVAHRYVYTLMLMYFRAGTYLHQSPQSTQAPQSTLTMSQHIVSTDTSACRDLKLDNTLLDDSDPPMLKLCDFGFAKTWTEDANMFTHIG